MNIEAQINSGYLNLMDLDKIAQEITTLSNKHGMKVVWKAAAINTRTSTQHSITAKIIQHDVIIWKQTYSDKMWHINMALMYAGVHKFLAIKNKEFDEWMRKVEKQRAEREEEARIASMPAWGEKIKNQR